MRVGLLASGRGWHVQDLQRAALHRHVDIKLIDFTTLEATAPGKPENHVEAFLVRTMPAGSLEQIVFRMDVLNIAEAGGVRIFNPPRTLECCIDKYLTIQRLGLAGLPVPETWCGQSTEQAMLAFENLGRDVVIKPLFGSEGRGMVRVTQSETAWRVCQAVESVGGVLYLQRFVAHGGWDVRVFVLGNRVLAAMKRHSCDWRTNIAQGGRAEAVLLGEIESGLALAAAKAVGCPIAGVDLLLGRDGWVVLEVNGVPGWRALSSASNVDVAGAVLDFVAAQVRQ